MHSCAHTYIHAHIYKLHKISETYVPLHKEEHSEYHISSNSTEKSKSRKTTDLLQKSSSDLVCYDIWVWGWNSEHWDRAMLTDVRGLQQQPVLLKSTLSCRGLRTRAVQPLLLPQRWVICRGCWRGWLQPSRQHHLELACLRRRGWLSTRAIRVFTVNIWQALRNTTH